MHNPILLVFNLNVALLNKIKVFKPSKELKNNPGKTFFGMKKVTKMRPSISAQAGKITKIGL